MNAAQQGVHASYQDPDFSVWELVREIWTRKWIIVLTMVLVCASVYALLLITTPRFSSHVQILIENRETSFTKPEREMQRNITDTALVANQLQLLRTDKLARTIINEFNLLDLKEFNPAKGSLIDDLKGLMGLKNSRSKLSAFEKVLKVYNSRLSVYQIGTSRVITVSFSSQDPELSAKIVNRIGQLFMEGQSLAKTDTTRQATVWLKSQIDALRGKVLTSEAAVEEYRALHGLVKGHTNATVDSQQLSEINSQLVRAKASRSEVQARARLIRTMLSREGGVNAASDVLRSPLIQRLREQQVRQRRQIAELSATLLPGHPRMAQLNADLRNLNRQVDGEARKVVKGLENEARVSAAREAELKRSFKLLKKRVAVNSRAGVKLRALEREAKANRELLESFLKKYREASARNEIASQPANARIISNGAVSAIASFPKKSQIMLLAAFGSFILGISIAAFRAMSGLSVKSSAGALGSARPEADDGFAHIAPALHGMPHMQDGAQETYTPGMSGHNIMPLADQPEMARADEPILLENDDHGLPVWGRLSGPSQSPLGRSMYMQQIRNLFQSVLQDGNSRRPARLLLCSVQGGEGESRIAADMARMAAVNRMRVVIIDADLRNPEFSQQFNIGPHAGLGECLEGRAGLSQCVVANVEAGVDIMPAGQSRVQPGMLMGEGRLEAVLSALGRDYDVILIKAAPPERAAETGQLAAVSDFVLLTALSGQTNRAEAEKALWMLSSRVRGQTRPGLIITGVRDPDFLGTGPTVMRSADWRPGTDHFRAA